jgi:hypothetical protein
MKTKFKLLFLGVANSTNILSFYSMKEEIKNNFTKEDLLSFIYTQAHFLKEDKKENIEKEMMFFEKQILLKTVEELKKLNKNILSKINYTYNTIKNTNDNIKKVEDEYELKTNKLLDLQEKLCEKTKAIANVTVNKLNESIKENENFYKESMELDNKLDELFQQKKKKTTYLKSTIELPVKQLYFYEQLNLMIKRVISKKEFTSFQLKCEKTQEENKKILQDINEKLANIKIKIIDNNLKNINENVIQYVIEAISRNISLQNRIYELEEKKYIIINEILNSQEIMNFFENKQCKTILNLEEFIQCNDNIISHIEQEINSIQKQYDAFLQSDVQYAFSIIEEKENEIQRVQTESKKFIRRRRRLEKQIQIEELQTQNRKFKRNNHREKEKEIEIQRVKSELKSESEKSSWKEIVFNTISHIIVSEIF